MRKDQFLNIADKVADGTATEREIALFLFHFNAFQDQADEWQLVEPTERAAIKAAVAEGIFSKIRASGLSSQLTSENPSDLSDAVAGKSRPWSLWLNTFSGKAAAVAAVLAITIFSIYFYNSLPSESKVIKGHSQSAGILPGTNGARLKLDNGKKIQLSGFQTGVVISTSGIAYDDATLVDSSQQFITASEQGQTLTAETDRGNTYVFTLADGTKVWLNAASSLTFPSSFVKAVNRTVILTGEAYFEVAKDKTHPFIVETSGQKVEVLGTHFNINSYADETAVRTTLLEGAVKVSTAGHELRLQPGDQALNNTGKKQIRVIQDVNLDEVIAWKNGEFSFDQTDLHTVFRQLGRWYNVEVAYIGSVPDYHLSGSFSRTTRLAEALKILSYTGLKFKIEGRKIIIRP